MSQVSKSVSAKMFIERMTIYDKPRRVTAPQPTEYYVRICARTAKSLVIVREFVFATKAEQTAHFKRLKQCLGV